MKKLLSLFTLLLTVTLLYETSAFASCFGEPQKRPIQQIHRITQIFITASDAESSTTRLTKDVQRIVRAIVNAVRNDNIAMIRALEQRDWQFLNRIKLRIEKDRPVPLIFIVTSADMLQALIERGYTALHFAAAEGNLSLVEALVNEFHANILARNNHYHLPFHLIPSDDRAEELGVTTDELNQIRNILQPGRRESLRPSPIHLEPPETRFRTSRRERETPQPIPPPRRSVPRRQNYTNTPRHIPQDMLLPNQPQPSDVEDDEETGSETMMRAGSELSS